MEDVALPFLISDGDQINIQSMKRMGSFKSISLFLMSNMLQGYPRSERIWGGCRVNLGV